jgi:hypothetical protein
VEATVRESERNPIGLDISPEDQMGYWFHPERIDPPIAISERNRDQMIPARREAGLPDWPAESLYPDFPVMFETPERDLRVN